MMPAARPLSLATRALLRAYPWRRLERIPMAALRRPPHACRVALVSSAGLVPPGAPPFDPRARGGDYSLRVIPGDVDVASLEEHHRSDAFDHAGIEEDRNVAFPLDRLRELARAGEVGEVAPRHLSFMGSITAPGRLKARSAPEAAQMLVDDEVDAALLVPV